MSDGDDLSEGCVSILEAAKTLGITGNALLQAIKRGDVELLRLSRTIERNSHFIGQEATVIRESEVERYRTVLAVAAVERLDSGEAG